MLASWSFLLGTLHPACFDSPLPPGISQSWPDRSVIFTSWGALLGAKIKSFKNPYAGGNQTDLLEKPIAHHMLLNHWTAFKWNPHPALRVRRPLNLNSPNPIHS